MDMNLKHHIRNNYQLGKMFYRQKVITIYFKCAYRRLGAKGSYLTLVRVADRIL